jgi:hypothetical protein
MSHAIGALLTLVMLAAPADVPQIKSTTKLTIIAEGRSLLEITAPEVLRLSNVYAGQFIGDVTESPDPKLARHNVIFDVQTRDGVKHGAYAVQFAFDDSTGEAFVYLPGRGEPSWRSNVSTIIRDGQDGRWHRASADWATLLVPYLR